MSQNSNTLIGILAGSAIGALIGVLFAPEKGSVTREKLKAEALSAKESMEDRITELETKVKETVANEKASLDEKMDSIISDASYKAEDLITALEEKLKSLKEKNKQFQKTDS
ncbi:MAG: YtxH domain-containing protein [Bacteroidota bacterium]